MMENDNELTFDMLPPSWTFCFLAGCPHAEQCLRHITTRLIPNDKISGSAVYPTVLKNPKCPYFKAAGKIHAAYGFDTLFENVKSKDEKYLRDSIKDYLGGHGTYYRYRNGEKLLTPEQQQWIIDLFRRYGYTKNLQFGHYKDVYDLE